MAQEVPSKALGDKGVPRDEESEVLGPRRLQEGGNGGGGLSKRRKGGAGRHWTESGRDSKVHPAPVRQLLLPEAET